jgi:5-methylcytosine-specific restriction endonuclease McrA
MNNPYLCSIDGCENVKSRVRGWCNAHYRRWQRYGDPLYQTYTRRTPAYNGKICESENCNSLARSKGLCEKHYMELPERRKYKANWYKNNRELTLQRALEWQKNNPESRAATHVKRKIACELSEEDRDISVEYRKAISKDSCFYCGTIDAEQYHIDHYLALCNGGTDHWWNLVRACAGCNLRKNKMIAQTFQDTQG